MRLTQPHLDQLACPVCFGHLLLAATQISCEVCCRRFPIIDGLPVLIGSRATLPETPNTDQSG